MADEHGPSDLNQEDPLESLLDDETDEEFGLPRFQEHFADTLTPAVLKDWSAKDFASIYVRFRPHLERHAKRFLVNPSQVEEVVQDAFLYLMTTLPELDSELGVLKFLKWKTRLLALDVIRANSRVSIAPLHEQREFEADIPEMGQELERADDAAIVSLALAKLQPRHREALIATLYEEKSAETVSAQMGLGENAFRQLLFRARAAFKKALIGEAEISGLSMSEVLSVAARKAAAESGKLASVAGAFLLVLALSFGVIPNLTSNVSEETASLSQPNLPESQLGETSLPRLEDQTPSDSEGVAQEMRLDEQRPSNDLAQEPAFSPAGETTEVVSSGFDSAKNTSVVKEPASEVESLNSVAFRARLDDSAAVALSSSEGSTLISGGGDLRGTVAINTGTGLIGNFSYDLNSNEGVQSAWFELAIRGEAFISAPELSVSAKTTYSNGSIAMTYLASELLVSDKSGLYGFESSKATEVSRSAIRAFLLFDAGGNLLQSSLTLEARS